MQRYYVLLQAIVISCWANYTVRYLVLSSYFDMTVALLTTKRPKNYKNLSLFTERENKSTIVERSRFVWHYYRVLGQPFVKQFALCYRTVVLSCLSCLSVCNVGVL